MSKHSKKHHANHHKAEEKKCYYEVLQVERTAPLEVIKQSYKKLALVKLRLIVEVPSRQE